MSSKGHFSEKVFHPKVFYTGAGRSKFHKKREWYRQYIDEKLEREEEEILMFVVVATTSGLLE